jgi:hypothetical protein
MNPAIKLSLFASGTFLLAGMLTGIWKYQQMTGRPDHQAPVYVDIAHRASLLYSFASLVIAKLLEYSPFSQTVQLWIAAVPLAYFAITIVVYLLHGLKNTPETQFSRRNFVTTWGMYMLIAGEVGGFALVLGGFVYSQMFI